MSPPARIGAFALLSLALATASLGCSSSTGSSGGGTTSPPPGATPQRSVAAAVAALFTAEREGDYNASFSLLSAKARREFKTESAWARRRRQLPPVTRFTVAPGSGDTAIATLQHQPALDPFKGLTPSQERETWRGRKLAAGWLLDANPQRELTLPDEAAARNAASEWASAVQQCDESRARSLQAVDALFGTVSAASGLCGSTAPIAARTPGRLREEPAADAIVAQYGSDALTWGRVVEVSGAVTFRVVLAPLGDTWEVIAIFSAAN